MISQLVKHRNYILKNSWNEFRFRYAGTVLGLYWNIINPIIEITIYTIIFSRLIPLRTSSSPNLSYVIYLITGLFPWIAFSEALLRGGNAIANSAAYLKRLAIPLEVFVATSALSSLFTFFTYQILVLIVSFIVGIGFGWTSLIAFLIAVLFLMLAFSISIAVANLRVLLPDTYEILRAILQIWRWTMPIIYSEEIFPEEFHFIFRMNPPNVYIQAIRKSIIEQKLPTLEDWILMFFWIITFFLIGSFIAKKLEPDTKDFL